ncbi:MAG: hypothetical protein COB59_10655 [Rhodospirillaceae bacterium]|nr:MAG: hypothetical protein COB59_10655 [Rhodospirillaceae bacterium]
MTSHQMLKKMTGANGPGHFLFTVKKESLRKKEGSLFKKQCSNDVSNLGGKPTASFEQGHLSPQMWPVCVTIRVIS